MTRFDRRFALLSAQATMTHSDTPLASINLWAFLDQRVPGPSVAALTGLLPDDRPLQGKAALVIGGSRGVGASVVQALALLGCHVFLNFHRSAAQAGGVIGDLPKGARVSLLPGDATDRSWSSSALGVVEREGGRLDILVVSASPPLRALGISGETMGELEEYVSLSLQLASRPIGVFLPLLRKSGGWFAAFSSPVVVMPVSIWPHYVVAKHAVEGLVHAVVAGTPEVRGLIIRPPRLRTELANTPLTRASAMAPECVAAAVALRFAAPAPAGVVHMLDVFPR